MKDYHAEKRKKTERKNSAAESLAGRLGPVNLPDMERSLLSLLTYHRAARPFLLERTTEALFYFPQNIHVYRAIVALVNESIEPDEFVVRERLRAMGLLGEVGGETALAEILGADHAAKPTDQIERLADAATMRRMQRMAEDVLADVYAGGRTLTQSLGRAAAEIQSMLTDCKPVHETTVDDVLNAEAGGFVPSGIKAIDEKLGGGFYRGEMIVVAARQSIGKSTIAANCQLHAASAGFKTVLFSLEETELAMWEKHLSNQSSVFYEYIRKKKIFGTQGELLFNIKTDPRVLKARDELEALRKSGALKMVMRSQLSVQAIHAMLLQHKMRFGLDIVFVDYMQKLSDPDVNRSSGTRDREIGAYSAALKAVALALDIPMVVCAQLNRQPDGRDDPEPRPSDLRECGSIELDADVLLMLYEPTNCDEGNRRIRLAKQRHGQQTSGAVNIKLQFDYMHQRITEFKAATVRAADYISPQTVRSDWQ